MIRYLAGLVLCLAFSAPAFAQYDEWSIWETEFEAGLGLVVAPDADESALFRLYASGSVDRVFDNGLEAGVAGRVEIQRDHPGRAGFTGVPLGFEDSGSLRVGAFSGLTSGVGQNAADARIQLEEAYFYLEGGYGQLRIGRDEGVSGRFQRDVPSVFRAARLGDASLDPTGFDIITTDHDLTGPAEKISYASPRIVGLRAGLSYTPSADVRGLDRDPQSRIGGLAPVVIDNAIEASLSFSHRFRDPGVRVRAAAAFSQAEANTPPTAPVRYDNIETVSAGLTLEFETLTLGANILNSNNGGIGDYSAFAVGVTQDWNGFLLGAEYGEASDDAALLEADIWSIGIGREVSEAFALSLGYRDQNTKYSRITSPEARACCAEFDGIVFEITLSH